MVKGLHGVMAASTRRSAADASYLDGVAVYDTDGRSFVQSVLGCLVDWVAFDDADGQIF